MKIFLSWSGKISKEIGEVFRDWLPATLQYVKPYFTPADIEKGSRWSSDISIKLHECEIGIFIMTKENLNSQWMMFEAGAISKHIDNSRVCPILFGLDNSDFQGPLTQFQTSQFERLEIKKMIKTINSKSGKEKLEDKVLEDVFDMWYPRLEKKINTILSKEKVENTQLRNDRELLEEILLLSRTLAKSQLSNDKTIQRRVHPTYNSEEFLNLVSGFIESFEFTFASDWIHTKECLSDLAISAYIDEKSSFIYPNVEDEYNNWSNRGTLLYNYRKLMEFIKENKLTDYVFTHF